MPENARQITYITAVSIATAGWLFFLYEVAEYLIER